MIQARDAMLAADLARFGGANQDLLWQGFAMRGFGQHQNTVSNADTDPVPDFSSPLANNATLNFSADTKDKDAGAGEREDLRRRLRGAVDPIADTDPATATDGTNATGNLDNTAQFVPTGPNSLAAGKRWTAYNFVAVAPGYGFVRFKVQNLQPGQTRNITIHFATNYASATQGATITGDALGTNTSLGNLIDDTESTNDGQTGAPVAGRWVVVALGTRSRCSREPRRLGAARAGQQPVHGVALVRRVRVHGRQGSQPDLRRRERRGLDEDRAVTGRRVPVRQSAARHAGR